MGPILTVPEVNERSDLFGKTILVDGYLNAMNDFGVFLMVGGRSDPNLNTSRPACDWEEGVHALWFNGKGIPKYADTFNSQRVVVRARLTGHVGHGPFSALPVPVGTIPVVLGPISDVEILKVFEDTCAK